MGIVRYYTRLYRLFIHLNVSPMFQPGVFDIGYHPICLNGTRPDTCCWTNSSPRVQSRSLKQDNSASLLLVFVNEVRMHIFPDIQTFVKALA